MSTSGGDVTALLQAHRQGDREALPRLIPLVYDELRRVARRQLAREIGPRTLHATALVHEAYLKLAAGTLPAENRAHFLSIAARAMRQVLIDDARRRRAPRHGGGWNRVTLSEGDHRIEFDPESLIALDDAMAELEPRQREVVELRFFGGMMEEEIATVLGVTDRTVRRDWVKARARLYRSLYILPGSDPATRGDDAAPSPGDDE
jgi:RNA polymerase sigma factor (TIGR02999 family)